MLWFWGASIGGGIVVQASSGLQFMVAWSYSQAPSDPSIMSGIRVLP